MCSHIHSAFLTWVYSCSCERVLDQRVYLSVESSGCLVKPLPISWNHPFQAQPTSTQSLLCLDDGLLLQTASQCVVDALRHPKDQR